MRKITICLPYYENAGMLKRQCEEFRTVPESYREQLHLIVVDDGSPTSPAVKEDIGFPFDLYRMVEDIRWNQDACRNLAVEHAPKGWVLLTDMDHLTPARTLIKLLTVDLDRDTVYRLARVSAPALDYYKPHPNSWFMFRDQYNRIGGYDERFAGYYGTDGDFRDRVQAHATIGQLPYPLIRVPREVVPDASTTTYARKTEDDGLNIRRIKAERLASGKMKPVRGRFKWVKVA